MGKSDKRFYKISRAKTFYKGDRFEDMWKWFSSQIETKEENLLALKNKYVIVIKEVR